MFDWLYYEMLRLMVWFFGLLHFQFSCQIPEEDFGFASCGYFLNAIFAHSWDRVLGFWESSRCVLLL